MISITGATKSFGNVQVLKGIDLKVEKGEFVSLLGPSGCGKTTLLRCLAGLEHIDGGEISIDGQVVSRAGYSLPPERRGIGMIFQSYALWPHMTVEGNIAYGLKLQKVTGQELQARVKESLAMVGLAGYEKRYPSQLSGGQQQRVALARSVAMRPKVLLFDEPLSNLDAQLRERMRVELRDLQKQLGITAVYVTHDQAEAMATSDRIVLMRGGEIVQRGSPREMYMRPETSYAADFLGAVNFIPATIVEHQGDILVVKVGEHILLNTAAQDKVKEGDRILLGIRHEDVETGVEVSAENSFDAEVQKATFMGATMHLELKADGLRLRAVIPSRKFANGESPPKLRVALPFDHLMHIPKDDLGVLENENHENSSPMAAHSIG